MPPAPTDKSPRETLERIWWAGVRAVDGHDSVARALRDGATGRPDRIIAVGKAAVAMAGAAVAAFPGVPALAVTKTGHGAGAPAGIEVIEAAHPVPDATSLAAGRRLLDAVRGCAPGDHLLLLVSGGASALAEVPVEGVTLDDIAALGRELLAGGLDIAAMNARRRALSRIKGGGLLSAFPGRRATVLAISDVQGDSLGVIGSGIGDCPPDPIFAYTARIVASNAIARAACAEAARSAGIEVRSDCETLYDDIAVCAGEFGAALRRAPKGLHIRGGEPTVVLPETPGTGGRNQALALMLAREIAGRDDLQVLVAGTDGTDGPTDAAGAFVDGRSWQPEAGAAALAAADSGSYLDARGLVLRTGPTGTNVMDLALALKL
ncbi:MOFRL family protein [Rhodobacteraceae bacterium WD3A24]|nr:MOFRL family protein [Rhodobacteraceae bacterium WD3A24]